MPLVSPAGANDDVVRREGAPAAAWLVRSRREVIKVRGAFALFIPEGAKIQPWLRIAVRYLELSRRWQVEESISTTWGIAGTYIKVRWLRWRKPRSDRDWGAAC